MILPENRVSTFPDHALKGRRERDMTKKLKIAFQGEPGANSHIAIVEAYPDAEPVPCATFEDALSAISSGEADLGMIPIENSVEIGRASCRERVEREYVGG